MPFFAQLDQNSIVVYVEEVKAENMLDENGAQTEDAGILYLKKRYGIDTSWRQTDSPSTYKTEFRKNYACVGHTYDPVKDAFIPPQPFNSWVLNEETFSWEAPVPYPQSESLHRWNEDTLNWELVEQDL